jgi:protein-disulfide isomerase
MICVRLALTSLVSLALFGQSSRSSECATLEGRDELRLGQYVRKKYGLPDNSTVSVTEQSLVDGSCYRKVRFATTGPSRLSFSKELYLSPDFRFLTAELFDSETDPAEEARKETERLTSELVRGGAASTGPDNAPITLVLFSDFQCPFCSQMAKGLREEILPNEKNNVRLIFRNYPLSGHPWARPAAEAMSCVAAQGGNYFWEMHDYLFAHQRDLTPENMLSKLTATTSGLTGFDSERFSACVANRETSKGVDQDIALGDRIKVSSTPTLFVNGHRVVGYRGDQIRTLIREQLGSLSESR